MFSSLNPFHIPPHFRTLTSELDLSSHTAVVAGGTQGIGAGIASRFSELGSSVILVGRSRQRGEDMLRHLKAVAKRPEEQRFEFVPADLSARKGILGAAREVREKSGKEGVDWLVLCQGGPPNGRWKETPEGIEDHFAVQILSRFGLAHELSSSPTIKQGVASVCSPGLSRTRTVDLDNLELRKTREHGGFFKGYGMLTTGLRDSLVSDVWMAHFRRLHPTLSTTHLFPGAVATSAASNSSLPFPLPLLSSYALPLVAPSPQDYADVPIYFLAHPEGRRKALEQGGLGWNQKGQKAGSAPAAADANEGEKVWGKLKEMLGV